MKCYNGAWTLQVEVVVVDNFKVTVAHGRNNIFLNLAGKFDNRGKHGFCRNGDA